MLRRLRILFAVTGLLALTLVMAPTVAAGDPCYHGYTIPPATSAETSTVTLEPCAFVPTTARVAPGTSVTFQNKSEFAHLVFGANAAWGERDVELAAGASRTVRFDDPGIYAYSCALHRGMTGTIVVGDPATPAAATTSGSTGGPDQMLILAVSGLAGLAVLGWAIAIIQRRRTPARRAAGEVRA
jgi:plastocyanin